MKTILVCFIISLTALPLFAGGAAGRAEVAADGWVRVNYFLIGAVNHMTGPVALSGERRQHGYELAAREVNAAGGINGLPIRIIYEDDQGTNPGAVAATNRILSQHPIVALMICRSPMVNAVHPIILNEGVPTFFGATAWSISELRNPWFFRMRVNDRGNAQIMARFLVENLGRTRIASLSAADAFGEGGCIETQAALRERFNMTPVSIQRYTGGTRDFTAQLLAIRAANADAIYAWGTNSEDNAIILRQFRQLGLYQTMDFVGSAAYATQITIDLAGETANDIYSINDFAFEDTRPELQHWINTYRATFGDEPDFWSLNTYDMVKLIADAARRANIVRREGDRFYLMPLPQARAALAEALRNTRGFRGAAGDYTADRWQNMIHSSTIVRIADERLQFVEVVSLDIEM